MSSSTLNPSEISELIKSRIEQFKLGAEARNEGTIISVSDGIVRIHGLADVMQGEMIELPGNAYALALKASVSSNVEASALRIFIFNPCIRELLLR